MSEMNDMERSRVVDAMCMTWRHDFGLDKQADELGSCGMTDGERDALRRQIGQLYDHHIAPLMKARSLPVGVPDGLIDELRNHAAARTGYTTDLIGRAADAIEKILEPTAGRWASYKEKYCGCKDASRLNRCRGLDNCELPCRHPDRNTAAPAAPTVKESLSVAPTVKAEHWKCEQCGASSGEACNANGCFANERSADASPSLPAAGSAVEEVEVVAWRYRHSEQEKWQAGVERKSLWESEPLMTVAQHKRIVATLRAQVAERDAAIEEWSGTAVQNGMEVDRLNAALSAQQSAPERVSVLSEALEDARRAMFAVLNQEPRLKSVAKRVLNAEIDRIDRTLLAGAIDKS